MTSGATQTRNPEQVNLLSADFQPRYEPNFAWKSAVSAHLALPGLRAYWPMSSIDYTGAQIRDVSGGGYHLTTNNTPTFGQTGLVPYGLFVAASSQSASRADGGATNWADVTGTETYIVAADRGLTCGCWVNLTSLTPVVNAMIAKWGAANQLSYLLCELGGSWRFYISDLGTAASMHSVTSSDAASTATWTHVVGRFVPSATLDIFVNGSKTSQATAKASVYDSTATFYLGYDAADTSYLDGKLGLGSFLCATAVSDAGIISLFEQTRAMYGA